MGVYAESIIETPDPTLPGFFRVRFTLRSETPLEPRQFQRIGVRMSSVLQNQIPTESIENVEIYYNETNQTDEIVTLHLGLIPLRRIKSINPMNEIFHLGVVAPVDNYVVTSQMLIPTRGQLEPCVNLPIVTLQRGHRLALTAETAQGVGTIHAKFSPTVATTMSPFRRDRDYFIYDFELNCQLSPQQIIETALRLVNSEFFPDESQDVES